MIRIKSRKWILETERDETYDRLGIRHKSKFNKDVMFSSKTDLWATKQEDFNKLDEIFNFNLDPCSTHENAKCEKHFTIHDNGLEQSWMGHRVFVNPPYGRDLKKWIMKAHTESENKNTRVVMLIPSRTDTVAQHDIIFKHASAVVFIKGRLKFGDQSNSAPFPSQIVVFGEPITVREHNKLSKFGKVYPQK